MIGILVAGPVLVPLATAFATALAGRSPRTQQAMSLVGVGLFLFSAAALAVHVETDGPARTAFGGWAVPFAVEFVADRLSVSFVVLTAIMGLASLLFQVSGVGGRVESPTLHPMIHGFLAGMVGVFLTGDLFNLYVWFEVVLITSLGLIALGQTFRQLDATFRYFVLNVVGTLFLLLGVSYLYTVTGHLDYASVGETAQALGPNRVVVFAVVIMTALLMKAAAFPVFSWLPATYHTLPAPIVALFAALGTKAGVYGILRLRGDLFPTLPVMFDHTLGWIAVATMVTGVLGAAYHWDMRRILAFHSVSQVGYMLLGIALGTAVGTQGALVFAIHHSLVKANLFLIAALVCRYTGSYDLRQIGGLSSVRPWLGALFLSQALSLVGIPPLSGFWAKLIVVRETLVLGHGTWAVIALAVGLLTLYSMLKIWLEAFWKPHPTPQLVSSEGTDGPVTTAIIATTGLAALTTVIGLWPEFLLRYTLLAARGLGLHTP